MKMSLCGSSLWRLRFGGLIFGGPHFVGPLSGFSRVFVLPALILPASFAGLHFGGPLFRAFIRILTGLRFAGPYFAGFICGLHLPGLTRGSHCLLRICRDGLLLVCTPSTFEQILHECPKSRSRLTAFLSVGKSCP